MDRGLYIAASGMLAEQIRQDQIANDLANASTPGYKADRTAQRTFGALLLQSSATGAVVGSQSTAVQVDRIVTDFTPKPARDTGEPLDFAIVGEGFFAVRTAEGTRECSKDSTSPPPAWPRSSSGSTPSPTIWPTPTRTATSTRASAFATWSTRRPAAPAPRASRPA